MIDEDVQRSHILGFWGLSLSGMAVGRQVNIMMQRPHFDKYGV
jgi:hypothetical protein